MSVQGIIKGVRVEAIATAVPEKIVTNEDFISRYGQGDPKEEARIRKVASATGVEERHHTEHLCTGSLALTAAQELHRHGHWQPEEISAILFVSQSCDVTLPTTANLLHGALGLPFDCLAYDIRQGCAGFVYGLFSAAATLRAIGSGKALLVGGEVAHFQQHPDDVSAQMLFGDAGFAMVISLDETAMDIPWRLGSDGTHAHSLYMVGREPFASTALFTTPVSPINEYVQMDGMDIFSFAIDTVPDELRAVAALDGKSSPADYDHVFLHQASAIVVKQVMKLAGLQRVKVPLSLTRYGNTSSASIPLGMCDFYSSLLHSGQEPLPAEERVLIAGFGVGLSWGTMALSINPATCYPPILVEG